jgi:N-acetyl-gamma-glutamylphosphate reductase
MKVMIFGATGMVGDGVLNECIADPQVRSVLAITRSPLEHSHPKVRAIRRSEFTHFDDRAAEFADVDACFF